MTQYDFFDERAARTFRSAAACIVPATAGAPGGASEEVVRLADKMIARRPAGDRKLFGLFLRVLEAMPLLRYGRFFSSLSQDKRASVLSFLETTRLSAKLRQGFFGLKTFTLMGYYGSEACFAEISYPGPRLDAPFYASKGGQS